MEPYDESVLPYPSIRMIQQTRLYSAPLIKNSFLSFLDEFDDGVSMKTDEKEATAAVEEDKRALYATFTPNVEMKDALGTKLPFAHYFTALATSGSLLGEPGGKGGAVTPSGLFDDLEDD